MLTARDIQILEVICLYYVLNRKQIQRLCFAALGNSASAARKTRDRLQRLLDLKMICRHTLEFYNPLSGPGAPVYFPNRKGCEFLAEYHGDQSYLGTSTRAPKTQFVPHWLAISETHLTLDQAVSGTDVAVERWVNEWDILNPHEPHPEKRYRLFTLFAERPKRLVSAPDAGFLLSLDGHKKVYYLEQDRGTSSCHRIALSKCPGFAEAAKRAQHRKHFPDTTIDSFTVLCVTTTPRRRDALREEIMQQPGADLWMFVAADDLKPETFLHESILYPPKGDPRPLIRKPTK